MLSTGNRLTSAQVDLIAEECEVGSESREQTLLHVAYLIDNSPTEFWSHCRQPGVSVVTSQTKRNDGDTRDAGKLRREIFDSLSQHLFIIDAGTKDDLRVQFNAGIKQTFHLCGDVCTFLINT